MAVRLAAGTISLRRRLILVPTVIVVVATALAMTVLVRQARQRVVAERVSSSDLADNLIREAIQSLPPGAPDPLNILAGMVSTLPGLRHVRLFVLPLQEGEMEALRTHQGSDTVAPDWFVRMLRPPPWERLYEVMYEGRRLGNAMIVADPDDEIAELWDELLLIARLLVVLMVMFVGLVWWSVSKALHPIGQLSLGLGRLEQGDFAASLPPFGIAELTHLGEKFNSLARSLARVSGDNRTLIRQLISLQETERNVLAHELHDELGPCLFGIRAQAACINRLAGGAAEEGHAQTILTLADDLQKLNRRILSRLRPVALQDLGIEAAVGQLVNDWRRRVPDVDWQIDCPPFATPPDQALALTLYRVLQECLTNAARHSGASRVTVEIKTGPARDFHAAGLSCQEAPDAPTAYLRVTDDGCGFDPESRRGFGLLGIHERVRGHGGVSRVNGGEEGTAVEALLPLSPQGESP